MTSPLASGGRSITLTPGVAVLLTEYAAGPGAPLTIINLAGPAVVYVAGDSGVSANNGVPISAGTSLPWTTPGQVWAIVPEGGTSTTITFTGAVGIIPVPAPAIPGVDQWSYTLTNPSGTDTFTLDQLDAACSWGAVYISVAATIVGATTGFDRNLSVNLVQDAVNLTVPLGSLAIGYTGTVTSALTYSLPRSPYTIQATPDSDSASGAGHVLVTVAITPTS